MGLGPLGVNLRPLGMDLGAPRINDVALGMDLNRPGVDLGSLKVDLGALGMALGALSVDLGVDPRAPEMNHRTQELTLDLLRVGLSGLGVNLGDPASLYT